MGTCTTVDLDALAIKYGTDKSSSSHWYTRFYEHMFGPIRLNVESLLEIGGGSGASIRMWTDWFPNALIFSVDQNAITGDFGPRVSNITCEQTEKLELWGVFEDKKLEIIIDDCSHDADKTIETLDIMWPLLQPKGWYVIEDMDIGWFTQRFMPWADSHRGFKSIQMFMDKGDGACLIFMQKNP